MPSRPNFSAVARAACAGRGERTAWSAACIRRASPAASSGSHTQPLTPASTISAAPQCELTIAGNPMANDSRTVLGKRVIPGGEDKAVRRRVQRPDILLAAEKPDLQIPGEIPVARLLPVLSL